MPVNLLRKHIITPAFALLLALHIFNISVDPIDPNPYFAAKSKSVNEMESITEIIFEKVLGIQNAFPENKHDNNNKGTLIVNHPGFVHYHQPITAVIPVMNSQQLYFKYSENFFEQHSCDILTPPPKV